MKPFDVHDQELIETAYRTGQPEHVHAAIMAAVNGFAARLEALPNGLPEVDGRPHLIVNRYGNFFDEYCMKLVLQEIADETGQVVSITLVGEEVRTDTPASPDVDFEQI